MPKLVDVVFDAPVNPRLAHEVRPDLGGDDLVGPSTGSVGDDAAVQMVVLMSPGDNAEREANPIFPIGKTSNFRFGQSPAFTS